MRVRRKTDDGYLAHHGVKGQKWGVRRYQNYDGTLTTLGKNRKAIIKATKNFNPDIVDRSYTSYNYDSWGTTKNNNILYITGASGSGKSTLANKIAKENDADYINIDLYTVKTANKYLNGMSKDFNKYLSKNVPDWKNRQKEAYEVLTRNDRRNIKKVGEWFDTLEENLLSYGESAYEKNKKVVAEGIQVADETLFYNNKKALKNKSVIIMNTSFIDSYVSGILRDNQSLNKALSYERLLQAQRMIDNFEILKKEIE